MIERQTRGGLGASARESFTPRFPPFLCEIAIAGLNVSKREWQSRSPRLEKKRGLVPMPTAQPSNCCGDSARPPMTQEQHSEETRRLETLQQPEQSRSRVESALDSLSSLCKFQDFPSRLFHPEHSFTQFDTCRGHTSDGRIEGADQDPGRGHPGLIFSKAQSSFAIRNRIASQLPVL